MHGLLVLRRRRFFSVILLAIIVFYAMVYAPVLIKNMAERKVSEFLGGKFIIRIGSISGGLKGDMVLEDVDIIPNTERGHRIFSLDRMEISYRVWDALMDFAGGKYDKGHRLEHIAVFLSDYNPFARGFIKMDSAENGIDIFGSITPVIFGDMSKRGIKGTIRTHDDGKYGFELIWDGDIKMQGILDPSARNTDITVSHVQTDKGDITFRGDIGAGGSMKTYIRFNKYVFPGEKEVIGDVWIDITDRSGDKLFLIKGANFMIDKNPIWGFVTGGRLSSRDKTVYIDKAQFGESIILYGTVLQNEGLDADLDLYISDLDIYDLARVTGGTNPNVAGKMDGELSVEGPLKQAAVRGRIHIGEGHLENMKFRSLFATLKGKMPVISIVDSRVVKEGGYILVSGQMDFSKPTQDEMFEGLVFETDNRVAVWEDWQINQDSSFDKVFAKKDRITFATTLDDEKELSSTYLDDEERDIGLSYDLDGANSLKIEHRDERDFFGLEHKMHF